MHKFTRPTIATPQAILAGGCDNCRISAAAQFFCVVPTNGTAQPMAPTGFTMGTLRLGSPWAHMSSAVVNGADIFTQEKAIVGLLKNALKALRVEGLEQVAEEHPPTYDPQANGAVESAVGDVKGRLRTCVLGLEQRLRHKIPPDHPVITWLVQHVTFLMNTLIRGSDGETCYHRVRGRPYRTKLLEFGELCRYKMKKRDVVEGGAMAARFGQGIFLGMNPKDNTYIIFDNGRLEAARTISRLPDSRKWNMARVAAVNVTPFNMFKPKDQVVQFREAVEGEEKKGEIKHAAARQIYLKRADFDAYGQTEGCQRCEADLRWIWPIHQTAFKYM